MQNYIKTLQEALGMRKELLFGYLFGSVAKESNNSLSDVDVAVYVDKQCMPASGGYGYKSELWADVEHLLKEKTDLVILNEAPLFLAYNILKHGKLIFCRNEDARVNFHYRVMRDYLDFQPLISVQNEYLKERLKNGSYGG